MDEVVVMGRDGSWRSCKGAKGKHLCVALCSQSAEGHVAGDTSPLVGLTCTFALLTQILCDCQKIIRQVQEKDFECISGTC